MKPIIIFISAMLFAFSLAAQSNNTYYNNTGSKQGSSHTSGSTTTY